MLFRIRYVGQGKPELVTKCVFLDSCERSRKILQITNGYNKSYIFSCLQEQVVEGHEIDIHLNFSHLVKDIQVIVERINDKTRVIVPNIKLIFNGHTHYKLNAMMTTDIIPAKDYNIECNKECIHYLPFCQNPLDQDYTSTINFSVLQNRILKLNGLMSDQKYKVSIMSRHYNILNFCQVTEGRSGVFKQYI